MTSITTTLITTQNIYLSEKLSVRYAALLFLNQIFSLLELLVIRLFPLFVPQSDIQFVGVVGDTFVPIKYYDLNNENRYFTMSLKTNDNEDIVLPGLENDSLIIEAQLL